MRGLVSVLIVGASVACGGGSESAATTHTHQAPHGGTLVELGDHVATIELVFDKDAGAVGLYVLDGEAAQSIRIAQPTVALSLTEPAGQTISLLPVASSLTGETTGDSSHFSFTTGRLVGVPALRGRIAEVTVKGQTFRDVAFDLK